MDDKINAICRCIVDITDQRLLSFRGNLNGCLGVIRQNYHDGRYLVQFVVPDEVGTLTIGVANWEVEILQSGLNDHPKKAGE